MAAAVIEDYQSSLCDLSFNSKPLINMLTMLAEENNQYAHLIVDAIESRIKTVQPDLKLPSLYLVDSIMKNIGGQYITLFSNHMVSLFSSVFAQVDEATRSALYKLRQTWNDILPKNILYEIDCKVNTIDPAWPITAKAPVAKIATPAKNAIHVNPKFLGGNAAQAPQTSRNQRTSEIIKKNEISLKDKEKEINQIKKDEIQKKHEEMLRLIEEKRMQLKALQQKKMEMAAKQKKKAVETAATAPQQNIEKKPLNHRDPRLKKNALVSLAAVDSAKNPVPLQSIVVVPKIPSDGTTNQSGEGLKPVRKTSPKNEQQNQDIPNEAFHHSGKDYQEQKCFKNNNKNESAEMFSKENRDRHFSSRGRNDKTLNKKHPLSPEKTVPGNNSAKKFCKSVNKSKMPVANNGRLQHSHHEGPSSKKGKYDLTKSKDKLNNDYSMKDLLSGANSKNIDSKMLPVNQRMKGSPLFGSEDKDYRHHVRSTNVTKAKQWHHQGGELPPRISQDVFYSRSGDSDDKAFNEQKPYLNAHLKYPTVKIEHDSDLSEKLRPIDNLDKMRGVCDTDASRALVKTEVPDQVYGPTSVLSCERLPPQPNKTLMLDGKNQKLYFVNNRCLTVMDNNEPRELTFRGAPRNVYIEGLPKPLVLGFDGRSLEFETEGKRNCIHFGTPTREVFINNYPYEAMFGGQPFTAVLEDKKEHRIRIDGPPPQVILSEQPAFELFEKYNQDKRISPVPQISEQILNKGCDGPMLQDVDMRVKPSHLITSSILPESMKDVDWRHVPLADGPQIPWNMPKDVPGAQNRNYSGPPTIPGPPSQWDKGNSIGMHRDGSVPERNNDVCNTPWSHPNYREVMPSVERPSYDQSLPVNQNAQTVPSTTPYPQSLPPPPAIPPSLNLPPNLPNLSSLSAPPMPNLHQLPNLNVPPPSWNPLPPPPMFTGSVPDTLKSATLATTAVSSTSNMPQEAVTEMAPSIPSLPINVETIYEKLVAAGFISKKTEETPNTVPESASNNGNPPVEEVEAMSEEEETPEPEILLTSKSLREFRPNVITALYKGSQCATCGMRFKEIQSEQYSRHLDWHFRMNRREKDGAKKAYSRRLYYEIKDWIQFKEIEEAEERTPSYFELQADGEIAKNEEKEKIQSVPASECETEKCAVCGEQFQLFWVEEEEEWHLRHAVRHDGEAYHPMCYEDFIKATESAKKEAEESLSDSAKEDEKVTSEETTTVDVKEEKPSDDEDESTAVKTSDESLEEQKPELPVEEKPEVSKVKVEPEMLPVKVEPEMLPVKVEPEVLPVKVEPEVPVEEKTAGLIKEDPEKAIGESDLEVPKSSEEVPDKTEIVGEPCGDKPVSEKESVANEAMDVDPVDQDTSTSTAETTDPQKESAVEEAKTEKSTALSSDAESEKFEDEFRPPTPDPRFDIQPPVFKGTELSALCTIM